MRFLGEAARSRLNKFADGASLFTVEGTLAPELFFRVSGTFSFDPDDGYVLVERGLVQLSFAPDSVKSCEVTLDKPGDARLERPLGVWVFKVILNNTVQLAFYRKASAP
jgi:hypothetical protein